MNHAKIIAEVETQVNAAMEEATRAIAFHESWRPMAYDGELHKRMGNSYAGGTFVVIREALRREMLLALLRVWDDQQKSLGLKRTFDALRIPAVLNALIVKRVGEHSGSAFDRILAEHIASSCVDYINKAGELFDRYWKRGEASHVMQHLQVLRNTMLAHNQLAPQRITGKDATDDEIEAFYRDTRTIVECLLHAMHATALDMNDTQGVYETYARYFFGAVRGERTEGHPEYHRPMSPL
ncbi:hypothetical protein AB4Y45_27880 [Paraburkholderia sp. EG287A]|uniref:AbiU2 domain-containing protein n=1 Tax=Paraburkholderia sp. EG287A TaxID=3237012 RepID=UPI0034D37361